MAIDRAFVDRAENTANDDDDNSMALNARFAMVLELRICVPVINSIVFTCRDAASHYKQRAARPGRYSTTLRVYVDFLRRFRHPQKHYAHVKNSAHKIIAQTYPIKL